MKASEKIEKNLVEPDCFAQTLIPTAGLSEELGLATTEIVKLSIISISSILISI